MATIRQGPWWSRPYELSDSNTALFGRDQPCWTALSAGYWTLTRAVGSSDQTTFRATGRIHRRQFVIAGAANEEVKSWKI